MAFGTPHCNVCPIFLGQAVPVVRTEHGYALFCQVCDLGHREVTVRAPRGKRVEVNITDPGDPAVNRSEEE